jgi:hypothetical protein
MKKTMDLELKYGLAPTVAECAEIFNESDTSVYRKIYRGELKTLRGDGVLRIPISEIRRFLNRTQVYTPRLRKGSGRQKNRHRPKPNQSTRDMSKRNTSQTPADQTRGAKIAEASANLGSQHERPPNDSPS